MLNVGHVQCVSFNGTYKLTSHDWQVPLKALLDLQSIGRIAIAVTDGPSPVEVGSYSKVYQALQGNCMPVIVLFAMCVPSTVCVVVWFPNWLCMPVPYAHFKWSATSSMCAEDHVYPPIQIQCTVDLRLKLCARCSSNMSGANPTPASMHPMW